MIKKDYVEKGKDFMKDRRLVEFQLRKKEADDRWDAIYQEALAGKIDKVAIICSMNACNIADKSFMNIRTTHE